MKTPIPKDEQERLAALRQYEILDTAPELSFDDLSMLAASICQTPVALVSFVDEVRQWFKSTVGTRMTGTAREVAFCAHAILDTTDLMEVRDALNDERFVNNPLVVGEPRIRFYAGAPLVTPSGHAVGTLCVIDHLPRSLTPTQRTALRALSRHVVTQLELRRLMLAAKGEVTERRRSEAVLKKDYEKLAANKAETDRSLELAQRTRLALLSVLEDERRTGRNLRESEERFRQLAENIQEVFWITDPAKERMIYISPAYEKIWGRTCESVYRKPSSWLESIHEDDRRRVREASRTKQQDGDYDATYRIVRPDGSVRWIHDRAFPVRDGSGKVYRIAGIAEDITEQRVLEAQFRQAQKMEALGTLSSGIAHDFNNILGSIIGNVHLLKLDVDSDHPASQSIGEIEKASNRAKNLVRQILAFGRQQPQQRAVIALAPVIDEVASLLQATLPANVELARAVDPATPSVLADATQIHQVLLNLCTNAWHAIGEQNGRIEIQLGKVEVESDHVVTSPRLRKGTYARLSVIDTGHGMDAAVLERIFEPFFTTKAPGRGTGLGLSVVHGIMQAHDGAVNVISQPGAGTTFQLFFRAIDAEPELTNREASTLRRGGGERILYLDDELMLSNLAVRMLRRLGYDAEGFTDPEATLEAFAATPSRFDVVITDLHMPKMSGIEFAHAIRKLNPTIPIILSSGCVTEEIKDMAQHAGIVHLLHKPNTLVDFSESLGETLHSKPATK